MCDLGTWEAVWKHLTGGEGRKSRNKAAVDHLEVSSVGCRLRRRLWGGQGSPESTACLCRSRTWLVLSDGNGCPRPGL